MIAYEMRVDVSVVQSVVEDFDLFEVEEQATVFNLVAQGLGVAVILTDLIRQSSALESKPFSEQLKYKAGFFWKRDRYLSQSARLLMDFVLHKA